MTARAEQQRASERAGYEIGQRMLDQVLATADQAERHRLFTAALVLCSGESHPRDAFAGLSEIIVPALRGVPEPEKGMATLAARAALAGHQASVDSDGLITISRWGRSVTFGDIASATAWLNRVTGGRHGG